MNYVRIYSDFIADRRKKESALSGYFERHHILPKSLGGKDDKANLINLAPEDHFFAHLLLAKIHGGKLWAPIAFMVGGTRKHYQPILSRKKYGWVNRCLSNALSGEGAHQYDWQTYELLHMDGRSWSGRQSNMGNLGISKSLANMLIKGRVKSAKGWYLANQQMPSRGGDSHPSYRTKIINFRHVDGRTFTGTQHQLHITHGLSKSMASRLISGEFMCAKGWYVEGRPPIAKVGRGAKWANAGRTKHSVVREISSHP